MTHRYLLFFFIKSNMSQDKLVRKYIRKNSFYKSLTKTMSVLLEMLLQDAGINYQKIESRTKGVASLENKIRRKMLLNLKYKNLRDIPDLSGIRIVLFFKDDIDKIVKLLDKEFKVHSEQNVDIDLNIVKKPKEFGYQSQHCIISIDKHRANLKEYNIFFEERCEIQIRTVLQHAWAEIEHGIGYKSEIKEVDKDRVDLTRMFSQNAALLEVADNNFVQIRKLYEKMLTLYRSKIASENLDLPINIDSIKEYIEQSSTTKKQDKSYVPLSIKAYEELQKARKKNIATLNELIEYGEHSKHK